MDMYNAFEHEERQKAMKLMDETEIIVDPTSPTTTRSSFTLAAHLVGPTLLKSFVIPDSSPELYRPGGLRAKLHTLNVLTEEVQLKLSDTELRRISFQRGSIHFEGGALVVIVVGLEAEMTSRFKLFAETTSLMRWTTGTKKIGEKG